MACDSTPESCDDGQCVVFGHKLYAWRHGQGMNLAPSATPTRMANRPFVPPATPNNSYEKGVPRDRRGMPYLDTAGGVMHQREYNAKRHLIEEGYRANHREASAV